MDPVQDIDFNDMGLIHKTYKSLKELRDFFLDGTSVEIIERKVR
jgi:hypothetical protein